MALWKVGAAAVLLLSGVCIAAEQRTYVAGSYAIAVDGAPCGVIKSVDGGAVSAQVIEEPGGQGPIVRKHIGQPIYEAVSLELGFNLQNPAIYQWITQTLAGTNPRHDVTITSMDYQFKPLSERTFSGALMTEITFPELNATMGKSSGQLTVRLTPESIKQQPPGGTKAAQPGQQKAWVPSHFRLQLDGLKANRVVKIDSFTITQSVAQNNVGDARDYQKQPGKLQIPNLIVTVPEADAEEWVNWHRDFVLMGNNDQSKEKSGAIEFLSADQKTVLARLGLTGVGIIKVQPEKSEANAEIRHTGVQLYVEGMDFKMEGPGGAPAAASADASPAAPAQTQTQAENTAAPTETAPAGAGTIQRPLRPRLRQPQ